MSQLRQSDAEFESLGVDVKVVTFDSPEMGKKYVKGKNMSWPMLHDEDRKLYQAYGFERAKLSKLIGPIAVFKYVLQILSGHSGAPGKDIYQLGGNVLVDPDGIVRMHHASEGPHDRPAAKDILSLIGRLSQPDGFDQVG